MKAPVVESVEELIGNTPLVLMRNSTNHIPAGQWLKERYPNLEHFSVKSRVYAKVECFNPGASVKDRIAKYIIEGLEKNGDLIAGGMVVEATSGNTGAGLALLCALKGYRCTLVVPDKMSAEKINSLRVFGADVVLTPAGAKPGTDNYYTVVAKKIVNDTPGACLANQYFNDDNPKAHYETTGPEIWEQLEGKVDVFACGIGTGGTITGIGRYLREKKPDVKIIAVDPYGSIYHDLIKTGKYEDATSYLVEGVGEDEIPDTMDLKLPDEVVQVNDNESFSTTHVLALKESIFVGGSCGFAYYGLLEYLYDLEQKTSKTYTAVVLLPDSGSRYLSKVFNDKWLKDNNQKVGWDADSRFGGAKYHTGAKHVEGVDEK